QRREVDLGREAKVGIGYTWQSINTSHLIFMRKCLPLETVQQYIAFLHHLTLKSTKNSTTDSDGTVDPDIAASTLNAPPRKCRKSDKKTWKQMFDAPPGMMYDQGLQLHKKKPILPFKNMVDNAWQRSHPDVKLLDGADWLDGFYSQLQEGDLLKEDAKYLSELVKWKEHKEHENDADQSDVE
ncbi:hypothetical protein BKA82DRAFT_138652, partial [Pisolithus tinctorius]